MLKEEKPVLSGEDLDDIRTMLKSEQWNKLKVRTLEAWKDNSSNKITLSPDMTLEALGMYAAELKYGIESLLWFFNSVEEYSKPIVDKKDKR